MIFTFGVLHVEVGLSAISYLFRSTGRSTETCNFGIYLNVLGEIIGGTKLLEAVYFFLYFLYRALRVRFWREYGNTSGG